MVAAELCLSPFGRRTRSLLVAPARFGRPRDRASGRDLGARARRDRKSTRLNSSHLGISYAVFCLKKKKTKWNKTSTSDQHKQTQHATTQTYITNKADPEH